MSGRTWRWRVVAAAALVVAAAARAGPVWFSDHSTVSRLQSETGRIVSWRAPAAVRALAPDDRGGAWIVAGDRLVRVTAEWATAVDVAMPAATDAALVVADPGNDGVWIAEGARVRQLAEDGVAVREWFHDDAIESLAVGGPDAIWVAAQGALTQYRSDGQRVRRVVVAPAGDPGRAALVPDPGAGFLWYVAGAQAALVEVLGPLVVQRRVALRGLAVAAGSDAATGALWVLHGDGVQAIDRDGRVVYAQPMPDSMRDAQALARDPASPLAWIGDIAGLAALNPDASQWFRVTTGTAARIVAGAPATLTPVLWREPRAPEGAVQFRVGARCAPIACADATRYTGALTLLATIDGVDAAHHFAAEPGAGTVTLPRVPAEFGDAHALVATVVDAYGVVSESVVVDLPLSGTRTVHPKANALPVASILAPANNAVFVAPATVTITAAASDADGTIARVEFLRNGVLLATDTSAPYSYAWSGAAVGTHVLTVRAYDNTGATALSTAVTITVKANAAPTVRITAPASNATFTAPATIAIAATATDTDGTIVNVEFLQGATKLGTDAASPYAFTWTNVPGGTYSLTARATDDKGAVATSAAVTVKVNKPPAASVTAPAHNATFVAPVNITLQGSATDTDGTIAKVEFLRNGVLLGTDTSSPYSFAWNGAPVGTHAITVRATDNLGAVTTSAAITVNVAANQPPAVAITWPANGARFVAGVPLPVTATATDPDGTIAKVAFHANDGLSNLLVATDASAPYGATVALGSGSFVLTAVATDGKGATTTSAPVAITVVANTPPAITLVTPADLQVVAAPVPPDIPLKATASDADGQIAEVRFYMQAVPLLEGDGPTLLAKVTSPPYAAMWPAVPHTGAWIGERWVDAYLVWAEATDNGGQVATSETVAITVVARVQRTVAIARPTPAAGTITFTPPATVVLGAVADQPAGAAPIARVEFVAGAAVLGTAVLDASAGEYLYTWRGAPAGTQDVVARVTEADGTTTDSPPLTIAVRAPNRPPVVAITAPPQGTFVEPILGVTTLAVAATATDSDGAVQRVTFLDNGRPIDADDTAPYAASLPAGPGQHVITAVARDDGYGESTSPPVFAYVPQASRAPFVVITDPAANSTIAAGSVVTITADVVAPDGTVEMVEFYDGTVPIGKRTSPPWTLTTALFEGVHALRVFAAQAFAPDSWSAPVVVTALGTGGGTLPSVALASPLADQIYLAPATVPLAVTLVDPTSRVARVEYVVGTQVVAAASARPFGATWTNVAAGDYTIVAAGRFDGATKTTVSAPRSISVRDAEFVELVSPQAGASFAPGDRIVLDARAGLRAGVTRIEFIADGKVLGSVAQPNNPVVARAQLNWDGAAVGPHSVEVRAYAADGTSRAMAPIFVAVADLGVAVVEPYAGQVHVAPGDVRIMAAATAGTAGVAQVDFYGDGALLGSRTTAPYIFLWSGAAPGAHTVTARVRSTGGATMSAVPVAVTVVAGATVQPDAGIDGSSVASDTISFTGTVQAPANAAVIVNGRHAPHDRSGRFLANNVALAPGANTLTVVLNTQDGPPVTRTLSITSTATSPFRVWLDDYEGLAPFAPTLTIGNPANVAFQRIEVDTEDDGTPDVTLFALPESTARVDLSYPTPGIHTIRVTVFAPNGAELLVTRLRVKATAPAELAAKVVGVYRSVTERLAANNPAGALDLFAGDARARYADVFAALAGSLPSVAAQLGTPIDGVVTGDWAELTLLRPTPEGDRAFFIYLIRGSDGLWRMDSM